MLKFKYTGIAIVMPLLMALTGCFLPPYPITVPTDLEEEEVDDLIHCQNRIRKEGASFVKEKLLELEQCTIGVAELKLRRESGLIEPGDLEAEIAELADDCEDNFGDIADAQEEFIEDVVDACEDVEELVFDESRGDPLGFQAFWRETMGEDAPLPELEEWAASQCRFKEMLVDLMAQFQVPLMFDDGGDADAPYPDVLSRLAEQSDPRCVPGEDELLGFLRLLGYFGNG